jgi:Icc-related predicted phosphoesterase
MAIPGNVDTADVIGGIENSKAVNLHLRKIKWKEYAFIGLGGSNPLPFHTKIWFTEKKIESELQDLMEKDCVLITHVPPYGVQDKVFFGHHAGSPVLRKFIDTYKPRLHLCGHIHEDPGFTKLDDTVVVNCTIAKNGSGALINLSEKKVDVEMLE